MDYNNYYEQYNGDEVIVHLDYLEPEPSLFQQSRGRGRPTLHREFSPVRTSKQRLSRHRMSDALPYNEYHVDNDSAYEFRDDDDVYERMTSRVAIQDQRYESNRSLGRQRLNSRENILSDRYGSGRSVMSRSTTSTRKNVNSKKSKFDLTGPNADSSFEVLATLIVQHLESKVSNSEYVMDKSDMEYFDAIMPKTLRLPFVEAVRIRSQRLSHEVYEDESNLDTITRKCAAFGLASSDENNFLLGGGHRVQDKIIVKIVQQNPNVDNDHRHDSPLESDHVQGVVEDIHASFHDSNFVSNTGKETQEQLDMDASTNNNKLVSNVGAGATKEQHDSHASTNNSTLFSHKVTEQQGQQPNGRDDTKNKHRWENGRRNRNAQKNLSSQNSVIRKDIALQSDTKMSMEIECEKKNTKKTSSNQSNNDHGALNRKDNWTSEKRTQRKHLERSPIEKISPVQAEIISVYTSPSTLDANVAAFEHEWRDELWNVFTHGICHPLVFLSFFAPIFALGQVMTRLKLNWIGMPSNEVDTKSVFPKLGTIACIWFVVNTSTLCACFLAWTQMQNYIEAVSFLLVMLNLWCYGFCVFVTGNTRRYIRDIYNIRDSGMSDYLLAAIYMPFIIAQMGRHTADYNFLQGRIFSSTGLVEDAEHSLTENMNVYKSFNDEVYHNDDTSSSYLGSSRESSSSSSV